MGGELKQVGTPGEIFFSPSSPEVTLFVGMENIFPGEIRREGDKKYFYLGQKAVETGLRAREIWASGPNT